MKTGGFSIKLEVQSPSLKTLGWCWQICLRARPSVMSSPAASLDLLVEAVLEDITSVGRLLLTKASGVCVQKHQVVCVLCVVAVLIPESDLDSQRRGLFQVYYIWVHFVSDTQETQTPDSERTSFLFNPFGFSLQYIKLKTCRFVYAIYKTSKLIQLRLGKVLAYSL